MTNLKDRREAWLNEMKSNTDWSDAINDSIAATKNYVGESFMTTHDIIRVGRVSSKYSNTRVTFTAKTTQECLFDECDKGDKIALLNFASFLNPGGGWLKSGNAQEESLCSYSGLYPVLEANPIYADRRSRKFVSMYYESELIYSKDVPFTRKMYTIDGPILADVITCSAPNMNKVKVIDKKRSDAAYDRIMTERVEAIFMYALLNGVDTLILGAWGCGVFRNDPEVVGKYFGKAFNKYKAGFKNIIFGIPDKRMCDKFVRGFKDGKEEEEA